MTDLTKNINAFFIIGNNPLGSVRSVTNEPAGFFMFKNYIKVFGIAFSLLALYQPIGKESKSELFTGSNNEYFTQNRLKKVGAMFSRPQPPTHKEFLITQI